MVIYLAGLQNVDQTLYEAADVDGANWRQKIWHITLPSLSPVILFNLILGVIATFQFTHASASSSYGGSNGATTAPGSRSTRCCSTRCTSIRKHFLYLHMGYASGLAWILLVIALALTILILKTSARWVFCCRSLNEPRFLPRRPWETAGTAQDKLAENRAVSPALKYCWYA